MRSKKKDKDLAQLIQLIENGTLGMDQSSLVVPALRAVLQGLAVRDRKKVEKSINDLARLLLRNGPA